MTTNNDDQQAAASQPPAYGEYATPEQQRAAAGLPPVPPQAAQAAPAGPVAPAEGAPSYLPPLYPEQQAPAQYPSATPPGYAEGYPPPGGYAQPGAYPQQQAYPAQYGQAPYPAGYAPGYVPAKIPGKANKIWTIVLLVIGLLAVISSTFSYLDPQSMVAIYEILFPGISGSIDMAGLKTAGVTATIVLWVGLAFTAWFSWFMYKKQKYTWWIPLVAGIVFPMIASSIATGPILSAITV